MCRLFLLLFLFLSLCLLRFWRSTFSSSLYYFWLYYNSLYFLFLWLWLYYFWLRFLLFIHFLLTFYVASLSRRLWRFLVFTNKSEQSTGSNYRNLLLDGSSFYFFCRANFNIDTRCLASSSYLFEIFYRIFSIIIFSWSWRFFLFTFRLLLLK